MRLPRVCPCRLGERFGDLVEPDGGPRHPLDTPTGSVTEASTIAA